MIQMRPGPGFKWYSPGRDLAYLFPGIARKCAELLREDCLKNDKSFSNFAEKYNVSQDDICAAMVAIAKTIVAAQDPGENSADNKLFETGFFELEPEAQLLVCGKLGQLMLLAFWECAKDVAYHDDDEKYLDVEDIVKEVEKLEEMISKEKRNDHTKESAST